MENHPELMKLSCLNENVNDSLIDRVASIIPSEYSNAWEKGINWRKHKPGSLNQTAKNVAAGRWPLIYAWHHDVLQDAADKHGVETIVVDPNAKHISLIGFSPENRDMAELMKWGHLQEDPIVHHVINGVLLGYHLEAVESWTRNWAERMLN
jgi:hypothetical protein